MPPPHSGADRPVRPAEFYPRVSSLLATVEFEHRQCFISIVHELPILCPLSGLVPALEWRGRPRIPSKRAAPQSCPEPKGAARMPALASSVTCDSSWGPRRYQRGGHGEPRGMSCRWHPIATRRWWLNELVPFPSMILPRDLHAWPCISSLRGPSRRRPPTWNPANAILCPLEAYLFMFASPIFFSSLTKRPRLIVCCLGPPKWSWHCWVPDSGLSCPFQASGNCLTAMLGSDAGGREAGHGS